jgi:cytochrome c
MTFCVPSASSRPAGPDKIPMFVRLCALAVILLTLPAQAQLRGHGGPVRALAIAPGGQTAMSGSFDQSAIVWGLDRGAALQVMRFHDGAVNAVAALPDGRFVSGGEDGRIAIWRVGESMPAQVIEAHGAPIAGLAVSQDGARIASASWDGTARITPVSGGAARVLQGHQGNVNAVAFLPDGRVATAGYDATVRIWPLDDGPPVIITLPTPLNVIAATSDGEIVTAGADGLVRILDARNRVRAAVEAQTTPIIGLALSPDGTRIAAAAIAGSVALIERAGAKVLFNLVGPGLPVWSLAFRPDGRELLTGGSDRAVRRWNMSNGEHIGEAVLNRPDDFLAGFTGERGAELFQACAACHTLTPDGGNRAGPTLHGIFGRRIATAPGYNYSEPLKKLDIVWNAETIARLFEIGPSQYTPGTKMPEQHINPAEDREALVRFLEKATR